MVNHKLQQAMEELDELERAVAMKKSAVRQHAISEAQRIISQFGLKAEELDFSGRPAEELKAKYRGPEGQLWSGRGRTPAWLAKLKEEGHTADEYLIQR